MWDVHLTSNLIVPISIIEHHVNVSFQLEVHPTFFSFFATKIDPKKTSNKIKKRKKRNFFFFFDGNGDGNLQNKKTKKQHEKQWKV